MLALLLGCGSADPIADQRPMDVSPPAASLHLRLAAQSAGTAAVTLAIRNLFDAGQNFLVDCTQKDAPIDGQSFCDRMLVVAPGAYEIVAQSEDPSCHTEQQSYVVVVSAGQTREVSIQLTCGSAAAD